MLGTYSTVQYDQTSRHGRDTASRPNNGYNTVWSELRVYTSKLTPDSVVTYLFHDCERSL